MGTWGTGIIDDDAASSVYENYLDLYDAKKNHLEIRTEIESTFIDYKNDEDDQFGFWFGLAKAQWECGSLQKDVHQVVNDLIISGSALENWKNRSDDYSDLSSRKRKLNQFIRTISKEKSKPRKPKKYRFIPACFTPGDCLTFKTNDGRYGAALVLEVDNSDKKEGYTLCGVIDYISHDIPSKDLFINPKWLLLTHHSWNGQPEITWCGANTIEHAPDELKVLYNINSLPSNYDRNSWGGWASLKQLDEQIKWDSDKENG